MQLKIPAILILWILFNSCNSEIVSENDLKEMNLHGNVKSLKELSYTAIIEFGEIKKGVKGRENPWNKDGYIIFNNSGNKIIEYTYTAEDFPNTSRVFKYGVNGEITEMNWYAQDSILLNKWVYKYDNEGNMVEENSIQSGDSLSTKTTYKYNEKGYVVEENFYASDGSHGSKRTFRYNLKGNNVEEICYDKDGNFDEKFIYKYDRNGNKIKFSCYIVYETLNREATYKYDNKDNIAEWSYHESYDNYNKKHTYKYTFDKQNNWIVQVVYINEIPKFIIERKIEYY